MELHSTLDGMTRNIWWQTNGVFTNIWNDRVNMMWWKIKLEGMRMKFRLVEKIIYLWILDLFFSTKIWIIYLYSAKKNVQLMTWKNGQNDQLVRIGG